MKPMIDSRLFSYSERLIPFGRHLVSHMRLSEHRSMLFQEIQAMRSIFERGYFESTLSICNSEIHRHISDRSLSLSSPKLVKVRGMHFVLLRSFPKIERYFAIFTRDSSSYSSHFSQHSNKIVCSERRWKDT